MPVSQNFKRSGYFRLFLLVVPAQNLCEDAGQFIDQRAVEMAEVGHQRSAQDQVVQMGDFFFFDQEGGFAAGHGGIMLERRVISGLVSANFTAD